MTLLCRGENRMLCWLPTYTGAGISMLLPDPTLLTLGEIWDYQREFQASSDIISIRTYEELFLDGGDCYYRWCVNQVRMTSPNWVTPCCHSVNTCHLKPHSTPLMMISTKTFHSGQLLCTFNLVGWNWLVTTSWDRPIIWIWIIWKQHA